MIFVTFMRTTHDVGVAVRIPIAINPFHVVTVESRTDDKSCWVRLPHGGSVLIEGCRHDILVQLEEGANADSRY